MSRSDIILVVNEDQTVPTVLNEAALKAFPNALGVAYIDEKGLYPGSDKSVPSLKDFEGHQTDFKAGKRIYSLSKAADKSEIQDDDLQPFVLLKQDDSNIVVVFTEGKFDVTNDGQLSDGAVLVDTLLRERFNDYWELSKQDVTALDARMRGDRFEKEMKLLTSPFKSTLAFMLSNGSVHIFSDSSVKAEAPWGFTSSVLGLKEGIFPAAAEEPKSALGRRPGGIKPKAEAPEPEDPNKYRPMAPPEPAAAPVVPPGTGPQPLEGVPHPKADVVIPPSATQEWAWVVPKESMKRQKDHDWYFKNNNGIVPTNLHERPPIRMIKERALKLGSAQIVPEPKAAEKPAAVAAKPEAKPAPIPLSPVELQKRVAAVIQNNKEVQDPEKAFELENKNPTFWNKYGITPEVDAQWKYHTRLLIAQINPVDAAQAWQGYALLYYKAVQHIAQLNAELEKVKPAAVAAEQPRKIGGIRR